ncbi:MAG: hypothetical protein LUG95_08315 [Clostridiales bacterium]|nr:hypothetical protein [Clostridiales bacterium]
MVLFLIIIFLGFSLAGYIVMNIIPVFIGFEYGLKIAYYLVNYSGKGTVYSVLMIIPSVAIFVTIIIYTLCISADMSKNLVKITKQEGGVTFEIKPYLKKYTFFSE